MKMQKFYGRCKCLVYYIQLKTQSHVTGGGGGGGGRERDSSCLRYFLYQHVKSRIEHVTGSRFPSRFSFRKLEHVSTDG